MMKEDLEVDHPRQWGRVCACRRYPDSPEGGGLDLRGTSNGYAARTMLAPAARSASILLIVCVTRLCGWPALRGMSAFHRNKDMARRSPI
jgi:hypothetical protein